MYEFLPINLWKLIPPVPTITDISPLASSQGALNTIVSY
jgi:hypothetical protein